jgi:hypothetical protein
VSALSAIIIRRELSSQPEMRELITFGMPSGTNTGIKAVPINRDRLLIRGPWLITWPRIERDLLL